MIILADTSQPNCRLIFIDGNNRYEKNWEAGRELAKKLLSVLKDELNSHNKTWSDIEAIGIFEGPGSFTGLRIGMTVFNTIADANKVPIVSARGETWTQRVLEKIKAGENQKIILPFYGSDAKITTPKK